MQRPFRRCVRFVCLLVILLLTTPMLGAAQFRHSGGGATVSSSFNWTIYNDAGGTVGSTVLGSGTVTNATGTKTVFFCCDLPGQYETYIFFQRELCADVEQKEGRLDSGGPLCAELRD